MTEVRETIVPDSQNTPLVNALYLAAQKHHAAFYAPGHKGGQGIDPAMGRLVGSHGLKADLPELPELDNLFAPEGVILSAQALAAQTFGADQTWFLSNGSTCGIEAALLAICGPGDRVLLPRNVHQSVISALILSGAIPIFIAPDYDPQWDMAHGVDSEAIAFALDAYPDIKAIVIVSPTYYGTCSDVEAIARLAHAHQIPLIVDEAHGPHFGFHPDLPKSALFCGADVVIQSTHKVLSAMSQASMLHWQCTPPQPSPYQGEGVPVSPLSSRAACPKDVGGLRGGSAISPEMAVPLVSTQRISKALQLVQSTSPNYLLLASLDAARHQMATQGHELMQRTLDLAQRARTELAKIPGIRVFDATDMAKRPGLIDGDRTRLTVDVRGLGLTGFDADDILHTQLAVTCELPTLSHLTFIISLGNTPEDIDRLIQGFQTLATQQGDSGETMRYAGANTSYNSPNPKSKIQNPKSKIHPPLAPPKRGIGVSKIHNPQSKISPPAPLSPREAFFAPSQQVAIAQAIGEISAELICPYPPGIPLIMPGEIITQEAVEQLQAVLASGGFISGCADTSLQTLLVVEPHHF